jgi:hypothetical protein
MIDKILSDQLLALTRTPRFQEIPNCTNPLSRLPVESQKGVSQGKNPIGLHGSGLIHTKSSRGLSNCLDRSLWSTGYPRDKSGSVLVIYLSSLPVSAWSVEQVWNARHLRVRCRRHLDH